MALTVTFNFSREVEEKLRATVPDVATDVKEAYALELFRRGELSHFELSQALGLDRFETNAYLKQHQVFEGSLTAEDLEADRQTLERLFIKGR